MKAHLQNHILLKFIPQPKGDERKYLNEFLDGSLYMNSLSYFQNEYIPDQNEKIIDSATEMHNIPNKMPSDQADLFEGAVATIPTTGSEVEKAFGKEHILFDAVARSVGFGYCNVLCFYSLEVNTSLVKNGYSFDDMENFGKYVVVIDDEQEFIRRVAVKAERSGFKYLCGSVNYHDPAKKCNTEKRDCFDKMSKYRKQKEWRIALYRGKKETTAFRLEIGDLRDICHWVESDKLENEINHIFARGVKRGSVGYIGNTSRNEFRDLFLKLGEERTKEFFTIC